jgi:hypothetical protein
MGHQAPARQGRFADLGLLLSPTASRVYSRAHGRRHPNLAMQSRHAGYLYSAPSPSLPLGAKCDTRSKDCIATRRWLRGCGG